MGAFLKKSDLKLGFPSNRMNREEYTTLLEKRLLPCYVGNEREEWLFQQDSAKVHVSQETTRWFRGNKINLLK